jgi:hypothetical protein
MRPFWRRTVRATIALRLAREFRWTVTATLRDGKPPRGRGDVRLMPRHEYQRNALQLDRNYNVIEGGSDFVALRLDYPGEGLSNDPAMMQLMQEMHFDSLMRYGTHPALYS